MSCTSSRREGVTLIADSRVGLGTHHPGGPFIIPYIIPYIPYIPAALLLAVSSAAGALGVGAAALASAATSSSAATQRCDDYGFYRDFYYLTCYEGFFLLLIFLSSRDWYLIRRSLVTWVKSKMEPLESPPRSLRVRFMSVAELKAELAAVEAEAMSLRNKLRLSDELNEERKRASPPS